MERTRIFARDIQHLTDARYFAAMGVDWMCFDITENGINAISKMAFEAIKEWVEGPEICILSDEMSVETCHIISLDDYLPTNPNVIVEMDCTALVQLKDIPEMKGILIKEASIDIVFNNVEYLNALEVPFYIDAPIDSHTVGQLKDVIPNAGIVLYGAAEEKLGFKNYDEIDAIIDAFLTLQ